MALCLPACWHRELCPSSSSTTQTLTDTTLDPSGEGRMRLVPKGSFSKMEYLLPSGLAHSPGPSPSQCQAGFLPSTMASCPVHLQVL